MRNILSAKTRRTLPFYLLLMPALLLSLGVIFVPAVTTVITSFTDSNGIAPNANWVGLGNYQELLLDSIFVKALGNNITWMLIFVIVPVGLGVMASASLIKCRRHRNFFQVMFLIPYVVAPIANSIIWLTMVYNPVTGIVGFLKGLGIAVSSPLANPQSALMGVAAVDIWHYWGFLAVVYFAALRQTPQDQLEAAVLDGCTGGQLFRYIYFPSMLPTFKVLLSMIIIQSFLTFDYIYLLTKGGPAHATEVLSSLCYTFAFSMFRFGKAAAVAVVMSLFGLAASYVYVRLNRREEQME